MYRLVVFGAQVQCENASDVLALIRAAQKTVATKKCRRKVLPVNKPKGTDRTKLRASQFA